MNRVNYRKTPIGFDEQTIASGYTRATQQADSKVKNWVLKCYDKLNKLTEKKESLSYSLLKEIGEIHNRKSPDNWHSLREL